VPAFSYVGAGKSTLLDVLSGKKTGGRLSGTININGKPKDQAAFSNYAGPKRNR
jgi:ABC-type multidrug transport system ATPase subunit